MASEMVCCGLCEAESGVRASENGTLSPEAVEELVLREWVRLESDGAWLCDECSDPNFQRNEDIRDFWRVAF